MKLRAYRPDDCLTLAELFHRTVHTVNAKDYTAQQLAVWATFQMDLEAWNQSFLEHTTVIAEANGTVLGFGDMDNTGYLDRLYVHRDFQNKGVATAILAALEQKALLAEICHFVTYASITAKPFFESRGYFVIEENIVIRSGIPLINYRMEKTCTPHPDNPFVNQPR